MIARFQHPLSETTPGAKLKMDSCRLQSLNFYWDSMPYPLSNRLFDIPSSRSLERPTSPDLRHRLYDCATAGRKENRGERVFELGTRRSGSVMIVCRIVFCSAHTNSKHTCRSAVRLSPDTVRHIKRFTLGTTALRTLAATTTPSVH
jgi:hypothetical protein